MTVRSGTHVRDAYRVAAAFRDDLGEDWVVPKAMPRYLLAQPLGAGATLLTAFGGAGEILGERVFAEAAEPVMNRLRDAGAVAPWREIPPEAPSAMRFLDESPP